MLLADSKTSLAVEECCVFFSFLRLKFHLHSENEIASIDLLKAGDAVVGNISIDRRNGESTFVTVEALIVRAQFPSEYSVRITARDLDVDIKCTDLVGLEQLSYQRSSLPILKSAINKWYVANNSRRAKILDVGGRSRSGATIRSEFKNCDFKTLDIVKSEDVDYVADAHHMSERLNGETFDFVCSTSTFEHLLMPWKVALEINKALSLGGYAFIVTHQCVGMHDLPHDYLRFSSDSWKGIFNPDTGFQIVETGMTDFVRVVPMHFYNVSPDFENAGGFLESFVLAKKIAESKLSWPVDLKTVEKTNYPA